MSKETRPFSDTQALYRKAVGNLIDERGAIVDSDSVFIPTSGYKGKRRDIPLAIPVNKTDLPGRLKSHNMTQIFLYGPETLLEVGKMFDVTRQNVDQSTKSAVENALVLSTQSGSPLRDLNFIKPLGIRGSVADVRSALIQGATYKDLRRDFSKVQISTARKRLSGTGIHVPRGNKDWGPILALLADSATDRIVVRELIQDVGVDIYSRYSGGSGGKRAIFVDIYEIAKKADMHPRYLRGDVSFIAEYLFSECLPIGIAMYEVKSGKQKGVQVYHFTTINFPDEAVRLLGQARGERFDQMRIPTVKVLGPRPTEVPNTNILKKRKQDFPSLFSLLRPFEIVNPSQLKARGISLGDLIGENPPKTVFKQGNNFFVDRANAEAMGEYLGERLRQLTAPEKM